MSTETTDVLLAHHRELNRGQRDFDAMVRRLRVAAVHGEGDHLGRTGLGWGGGRTGRFAERSKPLPSREQGGAGNMPRSVPITLTSRAAVALDLEPASHEERGPHRPAVADIVAAGVAG